MKPNHRFWSVLMITGTLLISTALPPLAAAGNEWQGRLLSNVNLRQAPGLNGRVICGLQKGSLLTVREQRGDWYRVAQEQENYGYFGWVYAKYVAREASATEEVAVPPAAAVPAAAPAPAPVRIAPPAAPAAAASPVAPEPQVPETAPAAAPSAHLPQPATSEPAAPSATVAGSPLPGPPPVVQAPEPQPAPGTARVRTAAASAPVSVAREEAMQKAPRLLDQRWLTEILRPVIRLLTVLLSCMALIISCRTLRQVRALSQGRANS
jgi:uncharacterized protein YraI